MVKAPTGKTKKKKKHIVRRTPDGRLIRRTPAGSGGKLTYIPPAWRFDDLIFGLGREDDIAEKLVSKGYPRVPAASIIGWRLRNSIPPFWVPAFIQLGLDARIIQNIEDLRVA